MRGKSSIGEQMVDQVCLRYRHIEGGLRKLEAYEKIGGYQLWCRIVKGQEDKKKLLEQIKASKLRGRGGAGFATGIKMGFIGQDAKTPRYLICNSDEGEPGTSKDNFILSENPHQLIEGILISCYIQGIETAYNYLRGEFIAQYEVLEKALQEAQHQGYVGEGILGTKLNIHIHNLLGQGSYIVGEETAMLNSIEGRVAFPRNKPPFPAMHGLYGKPTTVNNTESLASIPVILTKGDQWFANCGVGNSGGMKIFTVSGHVSNPGVFELPLGVKFTDLLAAAGGMRTGRVLKAVIPGGSSMKVLPKSIIENLTMDYDTLQQNGSAIGSGGVIVMDDTTCMVEALRCILKFYAHESCGQCTPCREGSGWVLKIITRILNGQGTLSDVDALKSIATQVQGHTICAFGEAFAWPILSFIDHFYDEFAYFAEHKKSKVNGQCGGVWI